MINFEEIILKIKSLLMIPLFILATTCVAFGQEEVNEAPQIMTSDLTLKQVVQKETLPVSFIIIDDDQIIEILINDVPVSFTPGTTVVIDRAFVFKPGKTVIKISAMDEMGNIREKTYLVGYQLADAKAFMAEDKEEKSDFFWKVSFGANIDSDSNPMSDAGLPIDIPGMDISLGIIPDSQQPDIRTALNGTAIVGYGQAVGYVGFSYASYAKSSNDFLASQAIFLGGGYTFTLSESSSLRINGLILDINMGGQDYSQNIGLSPTFSFTSSDEEGGTNTETVGLDLVSVNYADTNLAASTQITVKWNTLSLDPEKLDVYDGTMAIGTSSSGTPASQNTFITFDYDWRNKWPSGFTFDIGFGYGFKSYPNYSGLLVFGDSKMELPLRFSTGFGWQFNSNFSIKYDIKYTLTVGNAASSNVTRSTQGIKFKGAF